MISIPSILSAGIKRFIPGVLAFLIGALLFAASLKDVTIGPAQVLGFTQLTLSMFAGYVAGLVVCRKKVARTVHLDGPRSAFAGCASTAVLLILDIFHGSPTTRLLNCTIAFAAGAGTSLLLFAPWMTKSARSSVKADDLDIIEASESVLADGPPRAGMRKASQPTKIPRQISPVRAD